jgi:hypothetical protein
MAMKRYAVNVTRTITLEQTVYVRARSDTDAMERVQQAADGGQGGDPYVEFRKPRGAFKDPEGGEINEEIQVDDAYQEDED